MISVVIPLYNKEKQIAKTLQSVLRQTFQDFEIVVVNDGSTDNSVAEVHKVKDPRIRLVHQENAGVSAARNRGIQEARFDLIAFLDADDNWKPNYLECQYGLSKKYPQCSVYACNYEFRKTSGIITPTIIRKLPFRDSDGILSNYFEIASCSHPPIWTSAVMVRKEAIQTIGGFPLGIKSGEDLLTWARLASKYKIAYSKIPAAIYNQGEGYDYSHLPPRKQDTGDYVGNCLKEIYQQSGLESNGMREYISHWHKMRASVAMRYGYFSETLTETLKSLYYNPKNIKVIPFVFFAVFPFKLRMKILGLLKD